MDDALFAAALSSDTPITIANLQFGMQQLPGVVIDYDFCVQDVTFLDGDGREVSP